MINKKELIKNSLGFDSNLWVYQDKKMFNYSVDTILLANFTTINSKTKKILEVGTNNAALAIFLSERKNNIKIDAIEIQEKAIKIAKLNLDLNKKKNINLICDDFNHFWKNHCKNQNQKYDTIVCNPPFYKLESSKKKEKINIEKLIATHEIKLNMEQLIKGCSKIITQKGYLSVVVPPERLVDLFIYLRKYDFEPKRVKMIQPRINQKAILTLVEARFKSRYGTIFENNIYLHPENEKEHKYTDKVKEMYKPIIFDNKKPKK